jgi:hypothetical protein
MVHHSTVYSRTEHLAKPRSYLTTEVIKRISSLCFLIITHNRKSLKYFYVRLHVAGSHVPVSKCPCPCSMCPWSCVPCFHFHVSVSMCPCPSVHVDVSIYMCPCSWAYAQVHVHVHMSISMSGLVLTQ